MRKILSALLSALIVSATVTSLPLSAGAASVSQDTQSVGASVSDSTGSYNDECSVSYCFTEDNHLRVTGCRGNGTSVTIPSTYMGAAVTEIEGFVFKNCPNLETINIPEGVTTLAFGAFSNCTKLKKVNLPSTITTIGDYLFHNCSSIESITLPEGIKTVPHCAFWDCTSLKTVKLPSTIKTIEENAFWDCEKLTSVNIPSGVKKINKDTFSGCTALPKLTLPSTVTTICDSAFMGCKNLTSINIPSSVKTIGAMAFDRCSALKSITIPSKITTLEGSLFYDCTALTSVTLPSGLKTIKDRVFNNCKSLKSITIPSTVTSIGTDAFRSCESLEKITIPASVTEFGIDIFAFCNNLKIVNLQKGLTTIPEGMFWSCKGLNTITIPSTVTTIETGAFWYCSGLESVKFLGKVDYVGEYAFDDTPWADNQPKDKVFYIGNSAYSYCPSDMYALHSAVIKDGTTTICEDCFENNNLKKLVLPASLKTIQREAFGNYHDYLFGEESKLTDIYYMGTKAQWDAMDIVYNFSYSNEESHETNKALKNATIHYNYGKSVSAPKLTGASNVNGGVKVAWNAVDGATKYKVFRKTADTDWKALKTVTTTTYTDKTAVSGTTYYYTVRCVSPIDNSVYISSYNTTGLKKTYYAAPVLKTPSNVNGGVKVSWEAVPGASKYKVLRRNADSTTWKAIGYTTSTSYTDKTAESGKTYYYSVRCVKPEDNTSISGYDETGKKKTYYAAPTLKKATNVNGGVTVTWEAVPGASKYKLIRRTADTDWKQIGYTTSTSYTDKTAVSGTTYYYSVRCVNTDNNTALSSIEEPGLKKTYIAAPVLSKIVNTSKGVQLTWAASNGAVNYKVYRKNSAGSWVGIGTTTGTTFYDKEAESGKIYTYTVKCVNENATSAVSGFDNTGKTIKFIAAPVISSLTKTGNGITIKWNAPAGTSNHYKVFWKNENGNWQSIATTTTTSFTDYDVQSGTKYTYTIRVVSADENSNLSGYTSGKSITF